MKTQGINVDTGNEKSARINWGKIVGSAASGASSLFEPIMPVSIGTISNTTSLMRDIRNATRAAKTTTQRQQSNIKNSSSNKRSVSLFKSALDDIQAGKFTMEKINNDLFDDYETDTAGSFKMPSGDEAVGMSSEEILLIGNKGVAQSIIQSSSAQLRGLQESSKALINANIKSTQALGLSINNTLQFGFNAINTNLTIQNQKLDSINKNISGLLEFNNRNALEFYSKSIDMMAGLGKMMENLDKSMNPPARKKDRIFDTSNGFNIREYGKYIKEGIQESLLGASAGAVKSAGKDFGIMGIISELIIPKAIKEPLAKFDKSMSRFLKEGFKRLGDQLNKNDLLQALGIADIFGSKRSKVNSMDLGKYMKDATPWNGIAQKALVEVIPELLTSIDSKLDNSEKRYYDYGKGQFKNRRKIEEDFKNEYFDTFSMALRDSMEKLTEVAQATGRSDTDRLISAIQGLIDDQVSGSKDEMRTRREIESEMKKFGVNETGIKDFIMELTDGLDNAISKINDLYHEVGSTQHIYRNINNNAGKEYSNTIKNYHKNHKSNYGTFSFMNSYGYGLDPKSAIQSLQRKAGVNDIDLSDDNELQRTIMLLMEKKAKETELITAIKRRASTKRYSDKVQSKVKIIRTFNNKAETLGNTISKKSESITNSMFKTIFIDEWGRPVKVDDPSNVSSQRTSKPTQKVRVTARKVKSGATTALTTRSMAVSSKEERNFKQLDELNQDNYDEYINKSESENDRDQTRMTNALVELSQAKPSSTLEGSIAQSTNSLKSFLSGLMISFKSFTSRLFGKDGFFKKMWESDARKKVTDKLKKKLFTGENAIFKKQYEGAKAGMKKLKFLTLAHLGKGYDYLYDNTMQYMYGDVDENGEPISYKESEAYQKNKFVSQTLNRQWRRNNKRRKRREEYNQKHSDEQSKTSTTSTQKTHAELLGLPAPSQKSPEIRAELEARRKELKEIMREGRLSEPKYSIEETQKATEEYKNITRRLAAPIEAAELAVIDTTNKYVEHTKAGVQTLIGNIDESPAKKEKSYKETFLKKLKRTIPKSLAGAIAGAGVGLLNSKFSLLGGMFLPGGPISGAIVGGGLSILKNSEAFQSLMYGKLNEKTGKREGGLISEQLRLKLKKMAPFAVGGAVLGGLKGILKSSLGFNGGLGIMGMQLLPGGALGGALLGASIGILKNSDTFKDLLFGKKDKDGKRSGTFISNSFNKVKASFKGFMPKLTKAGIGLGVGALTGTVLSNAGFIPAMFSLGGPVGMGIAGLGLGIAASTDRFNDWMFGTKDPETGKRRKDGILSRMTNLLRVNMIEPIGDAFKKQMLDLVDYTKLKLITPFKLVFGPIVDSIKGIKDNVVEFVKDKFEQVGNGILSIMKNTIHTIFSPITKAMSWVGKSIIGLTGTVAKGTVGLLGAPLQLLRVATAGKRGKEYVDFYKNYYAKGNISATLKEKWAAEEAAGNKRNIFQKMSDAVGAYTGQGDVADAAREGWNAKMREEGKDHLLWRETGQQNRKIKDERKRRHEEEKKWSKIDKQRRKIVDKDLGGREGITLTDYQFEKYRDKFINLGIDEKYLQSSEDIMELLYKRNDFKKRLNPQETPEQKEAREQTTQYQKDIKDILQKIHDRMYGVAGDHLTEEAITSAKEDWKKSKKNLKARAKRAGIKLNLSNPELEDWNIDELKRDELNDYRLSEFYETGDLIGFMKSRKFTQKSKYEAKSKDKSKPETKPEDKSPNDEINEERGWAWRWNRKSSSAKTGEESTKKPNPITEWLSKIGGTITELLNVNKEQKELASTQLEVSTGGEIDDTAVNKKRGKSFGSRIMSKFNAVTQFLGFKKKQSKLDAENAESEAAREGTDKDGALITVDDETSDGTPTEEKKSGLAKVWDKIKGIGSVIGGSTIGKFLLKAVKVAGGVGLLGGLGMTIAELIRPGTSKKVGASIDAFNDYVQDEEFSMKKVFTDFSNWFSKTFIGEWWGKSVKPWWTDKVVPWWENTAYPWLTETLPEKIVTAIPSFIEKTGEFITKHSATLIKAVSAVISEIGPPIVTAIVKGTPTILGAVLEGCWDIIKSLGNELLYAFGIKSRPKEDISSEDKTAYESKGTNVATESVGTVSAGTVDEATEKAKSEYGLSNPQIEYNPSTGQYEVKQYVVTGSRVARTKDGYKQQVVTSTEAVDNVALAGKLGAYTLMGGKQAARARTATKIAQKAYQGVATVGGKGMQAGGWVTKKTLGKIPVVGVPFRLIGAGTEAAGKAVSASAHPIKNAKNLGKKMTDNKLVNSLFGTPEFRAGQKAAKATTSAATEATVESVGKYAQNAAGRWYDTTTGKFVKKEIAEVAMKNTDEVAESVLKGTVKVADRGLFYNLAHPINTLKTKGAEIASGTKKTVNKIIHPVKTAKEAGAKLVETTTDTAKAVKNNITNVADNLTGKTGKIASKTAAEVASESAEKTIKSAAKSTVEGVAEDALKSTQQSTFKKLLNKVSEFLDNFINSKFAKNVVGKAVDAGSDNILKKIGGLFKKIITAIADNAGKYMKKIIDVLTAGIAKVTAKLGITASTAGIAEFVFVGTGAIMGACDAANLFMVKEPDGTMIAVSMILEGFMASSIGSIFDTIVTICDIISGLASAIFGTKEVNFKSGIAIFLYKLISGFSADAISKLEVSQAALAAEKDIYNAINDTNLSITAYNDQANKTVLAKGWDWITGKKDTGTKEAAAIKKSLNQHGYSDSEITHMINNSPDKLKEIVSGLGYGPSNSPAKVNGLYAQGDSRWAKMPIGMLPDGSIATMDRAGCGPTALAAVANTVAERSIGYGPLTPADIGAYAASNGYISQGGANAGLFTEGATKLGLTSSPISNATELQNQLRAGHPAILTGKSNNTSSDPYTSSGHIVMADGIYGDKMQVMDPITGRHSMYDIDDISKNTEHAWAYSAGYGRMRPALKQKAKKNAEKKAAEKAAKAEAEANPALYYAPIPETPKLTVGASDTAFFNNNDSYYFDKLDHSTKIIAVKVANGTISIDDTILTEEGRANVLAAVNEIKNNDVVKAKAINFATANNISGVTDSTIRINSFSTNSTNSTIGNKSTPIVSTTLTGSQYSPSSGMIDYGKKYGYHTEESGLDTTLMKGNSDYYKTHDRYYCSKYANLVKTQSENIYSCDSRNGTFSTDMLSWILTTQYFGLNGGTYGSFNIGPKMDSTGNYLEPRGNILTKDCISKIYAAAIISEQAKGNTFITAPLSAAEKLAAFCNACRVMFGFEKALTQLSNFQWRLAVMSQVKDSDYMDLVKLNITLGNDVTTELNDATSDNITISVEDTDVKTGGIQNAEQLRIVAEQKGFLGKLGLIGKIAEAKFNSVINGTDFWTEFEAITTDPTRKSSQLLSGTSSVIENAIKNPRDIQDELLGKTIENIYKHESGGNYAAVITDSNNLASVGPYQANGPNAATLLKDLQSAQGIPNDLRSKFGKYADMISQNKSLSAEDKNDLSSALADSENSIEIKKTIDKRAMKFQRDFYKKYYAPLYDSGSIKDLKSLPLLADIGNTGPAFISDKSRTKSFISNWTPVDKEEEFEKVYELLNSPETYWKSTGNTGYMSRIRVTHDNLKDYQFKKSVSDGTLGDYFNNNKNPLGFGTANVKSEKLKKFSSTMNSVGDALITHLTSKIGVDPSDLNLSLSTDTTEDTENTVVDDANISNSSSSTVSTSNGTATKSGDVLTSISGSDRARFLAAAKSQLGYFEKTNASDLRSFKANPGNNNYSKYAQEIGGWNGGADANGNGGAEWCNFFTSWAAKAAGIPTDVIYRGGYVPTTMSKMGPLKSPDKYTPKAGDLIIYDYNGNRADPQHIGIVENVADGKVNTIEGNIKSDYNGGTVGSVATRSRDLKYSGIMGYLTPPWTGETKTVDPRQLLTLGYGPSKKNAKIDSPAYREQLRKSIENQDDFKVSPKDFEAIGFGPGMSVDAGFDMTSTDGKLDQILGVVAEWFAESKKPKAADSAATTNINMIKSNTTNVTPTTSSSNSNLNTHKFRDNLVNQHLLLSAKTNVKNSI